MALPELMTSQQDEGRSFEGIRIELPFVSLQFGHSGPGSHMQYDRDEAYERARHRVRARLGFYRHLATYAAVMAGIVFVDLVTGGGLTDVVLWFAGIWGALVLWHAFNVFVFPSVWSRETEERMIEEEMRRQQGAYQQQDTYQHDT
jgi:hypothetical protein